MRFRALRRASAPCAKGGALPWDPQTLQRLRMALFGVVLHSKKENCEVLAVAKSSRNVTSGDGVAEAVNAAFKPYDEYGLDEDYKYTETKELLKERLKDVPVKNIITPPLRITVPVLHGITHCMDEPLKRDMYVEILAHAMNTETEKTVYPWHIDILGEMSSFDIFVFKEIIKTPVRPCISISYMEKATGYKSPMQDILTFDDTDTFPLLETQAAVCQLVRMRLIEISTKMKHEDVEKYEALKRCVQDIIPIFLDNIKDALDVNENEVVYDEFVIILRGYGQSFAGVCLDEYPDVLYEQAGAAQNRTAAMLGPMFL